MKKQRVQEIHPGHEQLLKSAHIEDEPVPTQENPFQVFLLRHTTLVPDTINLVCTYVYPSMLWIDIQHDKFCNIADHLGLFTSYIREKLDKKDYKDNTSDCIRSRCVAFVTPPVNGVWKL